MAGINAAATRRNVTLVRLLWLSTFVLVLIGVAIVTRRVLILSGLVAAAPLSESAPLDAAFSRYASLTIIHIVPGLIFIVLAPLQFVATLRTRRPQVHRRIGRVVLASGLVTGVSALAMTTQMAMRRFGPSSVLSSQREA